MKVAITGSSGLIGSALTASLQADGHQVVRLVRRPPRAADEIRWDPHAADAGSPVLAGVSACVHLAGAGVGDHRWTAAYKAEIRSSRVLATRALATALVGLSPRPATFVVASAIGWYGDTGGGAVTEDAPAGKAFLSRVVADWEAAASPARDAGIRVVHLRSGLVLGSGGGVLGRLALPARLGVLPRFGDGRQVMSWISLTDEIRAIRFLLDGAGPAPGRTPSRRVRPQRALQPHRAQPGHQRGADLGAGCRRPAPRLLLAARPRPGAQAGPRRDVGRTADQRAGGAEAAAGRWLRVRAPHRQRRPRRGARVASPGREREGQKDPWRFSPDTGRSAMDLGKMTLPDAC